MIHEAWGIDDVLRRQAARLASAGYVVLAPDLLGEGLRVRCMAAAMKALQTRQGRAFEVVEACRTWLLEQPDTTDKVGVIGFCMGGGFAVVLASRGFDVSSVNYGMVPDDVDEVLRGACPVVGSYGAKDKQFGPYAAQARGCPHSGRDPARRRGLPLGRAQFSQRRRATDPRSSARSPGSCMPAPNQRPRLTPGGGSRRSSQRYLGPD